jgi:hypothetical protein
MTATAKPKPMRPTKAWAVVNNDTGEMLRYFNGGPLLCKTKKACGFSSFHRPARVLVTEIPKGGAK